MRRIMAMATCVMMFGIASMASATTYIETVNLHSGSQEVGFNGYLSGIGSASWYHTTPADFTVPPDTATSADITIEGRLINGDNDSVFVDSKLYGTLNSGAWTFTHFDLDVAQIFAQWNLGEKLNVTVNYIENYTNGWSDILYLDNSVFTLKYDEGGNNGEVGNNGDTNTPTPEPATLLLLGSGLSGLAFWGKRRRIEE